MVEPNIWLMRMKSIWFRITLCGRFAADFQEEKWRLFLVPLFKTIRSIYLLKFTHFGIEVTHNYVGVVFLHHLSSSL